MKFSAKSLSVALAIATTTTTTTTTTTASASASSTGESNNGLPSHHPPVRSRALHPTLAKFSPQFRCPYAQEWLAKGAHKAAIDLGLTTGKKTSSSTGSSSKNEEQEAPHSSSSSSSSPDEQRRRALQAQAAAATASAVMGSCTYDNVWSVSENDRRSCMEFRGEGWTENDMDERCGNEPNNSVSMNGEECVFPEASQLAGWCVKESGFVTVTESFAESSNASNNAMVEASAMMVSGASDCNGNKMACETFVGGSWRAAVACGGSGSGSGTTTTTTTTTDQQPPAGMMNGAPGGFDYTMGPPSGAGGSDGTCLLAPGKSAG